MLEKEVHDIVFRGRASRLQAIDVAELKRLTVEKAPSQTNLQAAKGKQMALSSTNLGSLPSSSARDGAMFAKEFRLQALTGADDQTSIIGADAGKKS